MITESRSGAIARITLDRPDRHNAFDEHVIAALTSALDAVAADPSARVVILTGAGASFSAGADLGWMGRMAAASHAENLADAAALAALLERLDTMPQPVIALVNGPAYGGGVGLIAACDIALAVPGAQFSLSEVRLGLIPAVIGPYVARAIGARACRRYFLTAERFSALTAEKLGLVTVVDELELAVKPIVDALLLGGPQAQAAAKALLRDIAAAPEDLTARTVAAIADRRASAEGQDGIAAFLEKRKAGWIGG